MHPSLNTRNLGQKALASLMTVILAGLCVLPQDKSNDYTFRVKTELVMVNVTVRDKNGNPVKDLRREDFTVLEDNKPQQIASFDLENTDKLVSQTVKDLVAGSGLSFRDHGAAALKGVEGEWKLLCGRRIGMPISKRKNANPSAAAGVASTASSAWSA